jgi:hypothetical protein
MQVFRDTTERPASAWRWWLVLALVTAYVFAPGPYRGIFSGLPLSSKATALFTALTILAIFTGMFRPYRRIHGAWPIALLVLIGLKLFLAPALVTSGWRGTYRTAVRRADKTYSPLVTQYFLGPGPIANTFRIDPVIAFDGPGFGLSFMNENPSEGDDRLQKPPYDVVQPLIVHWMGHVYATSPRPVMMTVSAAGRLAVDVDGRRVFDARDPNGATVSVNVATGPHVIAISYVKPVGATPMATIETGEPVTIAPADPARLQKSANANRAINALGILALLMLAGAAIDAYTPVARLLMHEVWQRPDKLAAFVLASLFIFHGLTIMVPSKHLTFLLGRWDDHVAYEGSSRLIARNGLMQVYDDGHGEPYFFYPLYPYALAGAHLLVGDDFSTVYLLNYYCIAAVVLLMWALLRNHLARGSMVLVLLLGVAPVGGWCLGYYAMNAYSDNLFAPLVLLMLLVCTTAFTRRSVGLLLVTGLATAVAAAARSSLMVHVAYVPLALLLLREFGSLRRRIVGGTAFVAGFFAGIAPFTIRNWIVSHKFILLVSTIVEIPHFLFIGGEEAPVAPASLRTSTGEFVTLGDSLRSFARVYMSAPLHFTWMELRKVLFTLGYSVGPHDVHVPTYLFLFPLAFAAALWLRRVPRPMAAALLAFCASHMMAMVMAAPWTYGYKTMLPFILATMAGGAFLFRKADEAKRVSLPLAPLAVSPRVSVIVTGTGAARRAEDVRAASVADEVIVGGETGDREALLRAFREAAGDFVVVFPADERYAVAGVRRLLAFADSYAAVFGGRERERNLPGVVFSRFFAKFVSAFCGGGAELWDAHCPVWMMRRETFAALAAELCEEGDDLPIEVLARTARSGARVFQVPINLDPPASWPVSDLSFRRVGHSLRVIASVVRGRKAPAAAVAAVPAYVAPPASPS